MNSEILTSPLNLWKMMLRAEFGLVASNSFWDVFAQIAVVCIAYESRIDSKPIHLKSDQQIGVLSESKDLTEIGTRCIFM